MSVHTALFISATRGPKHDARTKSVPQSPATNGETFDIDPDSDPVTDEGDVDGERAAAESATTESVGETKRSLRSHGNPTKTGRSERTGNEQPERVFGAEGDRSASDLATSFTRVFPQTASADSSWATAPMGATGTVDVVLTIDDAGNVIGSEIHGGGSSALRRGIERTLVLLKHRTFTAHGYVTTLHVSAVVSPDSVHDGLHGDVFALGGSFSETEGDAFFALAIGRRIDVRITSK